MLRRQGLQLGSRYYAMALSRQLPSASFFGLNELNERSDRRIGIPKMVSFESSGASVANSGKASRSINCLNRHDGVLKRSDNGDVGKVNVVAPYKQPFRHSDVFFNEKGNENLVNGHGISKNGRPIGYSDTSDTKKMVVAVDVDEVLGSFVSALNKFVADRYCSYHSVSEYYVYEFFKIWNCSRTEADLRVHEFFKTDYFKNGIHPIPGAWYTLHKLSALCKLSVVTSRQNVIRDHTLEWLDKHFPGLFHDVHFGNHFALHGKSRPKSEICRSMGAQVLIDDNPRYALDCADVGIKVLLFDYDNSYPWSKSRATDSHPLITKVHNWHEVEEHLFSWIPS